VVKILYVHRGAEIAGANRALLNLFERLDRSRFQPVSLLPQKGPMETELRVRNVPYHVCDVISPTLTGGRSSQLKATWSLARLLRKEAVTLVHANTAAAYHLSSLAAKLLGRKRLCHLQLTPQPGALERSFRIPPHAVITCSHSMLAENADLLARICPSAIRRAIVNAVDTDRLIPGPPSERLLQELRLAPGTRVVSILGQVSERKGHPRFVEMAKALAAEFPRTRFLVIGSDLKTAGAYEHQMKDYARDLGVDGIVSFLGFRSDTGDLIRASDVIVLPSRDEGLPLSLVEAAACAKPIVAYHLPGVAEAVLNGQTGIVTAPNLTELVQAVGKLLREDTLREQMGTAGRRHMEENFSLAAQTAHIQNLYAELLA
jgi:glycosyltransferase involved in cell wall biosynthesis